MQTPSATTLRTGIIAEPGAAHLPHYLESLAACAHLAPLAYADPTGSSLESAQAALTGVQLYESPGQMLREFRPQFVIVLLEAAHGAEWILAALRAGCDVLTEKHPVTEVRDLERLFDEAQTRGLRLTLALSSRANPAVGKAREVLAALGEVMSASVYVVADQTRLRDEEYRRSWRCDARRAGGGILMAIGIHQIDLLLHLSGLAVREVTAICTNAGGEAVKIEDAAAVALKLSNGALATVHAGFYLDAAYQGGLHLWLTRGWLRLDPIASTITWQSHDDETAQNWRAEMTDVNQTRDFFQETIDAIRLDRSPLVNGQQGRQVLQTVFAAYESSATGRTVTLH